MVLAQFDLLTSRPTVQRPSLMLGLNLTPCFTAALNFLISSRNATGSTPSSLSANSSMVLADHFDKRLMRYSWRSIGTILPANTCQAKLLGWRSTIAPYFA